MCACANCQRGQNSDPNSPCVKHCQKASLRMLLSICYVPAACYSHDYSADTFLWTSFDQTFGASIDASHRRMLRSIAQARCRCIAKTFATAQALRLIGLRRHWHAPGKKKQQRWSRSSGDCHAYKPAPSSTLPGCASSPVQMRRSDGRKKNKHIDTR